MVINCYSFKQHLSHCISITCCYNGASLAKNRIGCAHILGSAPHLVCFDSETFAVDFAPTISVGKLEETDCVQCHLESWRRSNKETSDWLGDVMKGETDGYSLWLWRKRVGK